MGAVRSRKGRPVTLAALLSGLAFATALASCGGPDGPGDPGPNGLGERFDDRKVSKFLEDCEAGVEDWTSGRVNYPRRLTVPMGDSRSYRASIDIRAVVLQPPEDVRLTDEMTGEPVAVRCAVGARLAPVGDGLEVRPDDWIAREFTPVGVVNWSWSITGEAPGDHQVSLMLHPAVSTPDGKVLPTQSEPLTTTFVTDVAVDASAAQLVVRWIEENLVTIIVALGGLVLATLFWAGQIVDAWHKFVAKLRRRATTPRPDEPEIADPPEGESRSSATGDT